MNARALFKLFLEENPGFVTDRTSERVEKYGKVDTTTAYRMVRKTKWIYNSPTIYVDVIKQKLDGSFEVLHHKAFADEQELFGGRFVGKQYKDAIYYAHEYVETLTNNVGV